MASVVISEAIILIASILVAIAISGIVMSKIGVFESTFTATTNAQQDLMLTKTKILYATNPTSTTINVWIKNVGTKPITGLTSMDVYFGQIGSVDYIPYNAASNPKWVYTDGLPSNGVWDITETIQITITTSSSVSPSTTHLISVSTSNGVLDEYIFTPL